MAKIDVIRARHSVRKYTGASIEGDVLAVLKQEVAEAAAHSGVDFQLVLDNPEAFDVVARFGLIYGCNALIAVPYSDKAQDEAIGYWGQRIVLRAQELGLNTCWAAICNRKKVRAELKAGQKIRLMIAVGYGQHQGRERKTKPLEELCTVEGGGEMPAWFARGMEAAQLAPTGVNAQNFHITLLADGHTVRAEAQKRALRIIDLGIVKCNFEVAARELSNDWNWE